MPVKFQLLLLLFVSFSLSSCQDKSSAFTIYTDEANIFHAVRAYQQEHPDQVIYIEYHQGAELLFTLAKRAKNKSGLYLSSSLDKLPQAQQYFQRFNAAEQFEKQRSAISYPSYIQSEYLSPLALYPLYYAMEFPLNQVKLPSPWLEHSQMHLLDMNWLFRDQLFPSSGEQGQGLSWLGQLPEKSLYYYQRGLGLNYSMGPQSLNLNAGNQDREAAALALNFEVFERAMSHYAEDMIQIHSSSVLSEYYSKLAPQSFYLASMSSSEGEVEAVLDRILWMGVSSELNRKALKSIQSFSAWLQDPENQARIIYQEYQKQRNRGFLFSGVSPYSNSNNLVWQALGVGELANYNIRWRYLGPLWRASPELLAADLKLDGNFDVQMLQDWEIYSKLLLPQMTEKKENLDDEQQNATELSFPEEVLDWQSKLRRIDRFVQ